MCTRLTARLLLRPLQMDDLDIASRIHGDPQTNRHNPDGPRSREQTQALLTLWTQFHEQHGFGYWTICDREQPGRVLGFGGVMRKAIGPVHGLNMYFRLATHAWGQGYAQEMAGAALSLAFETLGEKAVYGLTRPTNLPSRRILQKIGMNPYLETDDVPGEPASLIYRVTAGDFFSQRCARQ